jgi:hypothetical protein
MVSGEIHVFVLWLLDEALEISPCLYTMTDHVESDDISERDVACRVFFDEGFVHQLGTTSRRKAEYKRLFGRQSMGFDPFY